MLAYMSFLIEHWRRTYSIDPLERSHREIPRRTGAVGVSPNGAATRRLVGMLLLEQSGE